MNIKEQQSWTEEMHEISSESGSRASVCISVDEAIRISKIIGQAPEERLPMILSVLERARIYIDGLDRIEEWKALKDQAYIVDMEEFVAALTKDGDANASEVQLKPKVFDEICKQFNVKPSCAKRALYRKGLIKTTISDTASRQKIEYTVPIWVDGRTERRVVILNKAGGAG